MHLEWRHRRVTDRPWNKLLHAHACAYTDELPVSVWRCGYVTAPHFVLRSEVLPEFELWLHFPATAVSNSKASKLPLHLILFNLTFHSSALKFDFVVFWTQLLQASVSCCGGLGWSTAGLSLLCSGFIAVGPAQLLFLMKQRTSRQFVSFCRCRIHTRTPISYPFFPSGTTPLFSDNASVVSQ